jgi:hypothetical protein
MCLHMYLRSLLSLLLQAQTLHGNHSRLHRKCSVIVNAISQTIRMQQQQSVLGHLALLAQRHHLMLLAHTR